MNALTKSTIGGFSVEFVEEYGATSVTIAKGEYCSSLDFAQMHGEIEDSYTGRTMPIRQATVEKIQAWANSLGY